MKDNAKRASFATNQLVMEVHIVGMCGRDEEL
jgi:hypothetical protein